VLDRRVGIPITLAVLHGWRAAGALDSVRRGLELFGLGSLAEMAEAPARTSAGVLGMVRITRQGWLSSQARSRYLHSVV